MSLGLREQPSMSAFFDARADTYDELTKRSDQVGLYTSVARLIPATEAAVRIADLGVGTGYELEAIFERAPYARILGVDIAPGMLAALRERYPEQVSQIELRESSLRDLKFGDDCFDYVLSIATMHHFIPDERVDLYGRIAAALKPGGLYIEADKFVPKSLELHLMRKHIAAVKGNPSLAWGGCHIDVPSAQRTARTLLSRVGLKASVAWQDPSCTKAILVAVRHDGP